MPRRGPGLLPILILASLVLLGSAGSAWAHRDLLPASPAPSHAQHADGAASLLGDGLRTLALSAASEAPALPWPALLGMLMAVLLGWRRPRRALALAIVVLLAVLAFEDGLHSVHHLDDLAKLARCAVAGATAQLTATTVDGVASADAPLAVIAVAPEGRQADPIARSVCPDQGRAPPPAG
jgi:hypothetical protein